MVSWKLLRWGIRNFENSKNRHFEDSIIRGPVGLWTFQIRCVPLFGWGDLEKTALFSVKGVKRELWMFFRLTPWGGGGGVVIRVR